MKTNTKFSKLSVRQQSGGTPASDIWHVNSECGTLRDVLIGPVEYFSWTSGNAVAQRTERQGLQFDHQVVKTQYAEMLEAYKDAGVQVHQLRADPHLPYQIFARDSSVMTPWGAIIMQLQKKYRRGEYAECLQFFLDNDIPIYDLVTAGNVEGGDLMILKPGVAVCGFSGERSIHSAVKQIEEWFQAEGWEFYSYHFDSHFLHLDVQLGMIAPDLAVACTEVLEPAFLNWLRNHKIRLIEVSYAQAMQMGTNLVALGNERVMISAHNKELIKICRAEGLSVFDPDVSMIAAGGGSLHCMCQPLKRDPI